MESHVSEEHYMISVMPIVKDQISTLYPANVIEIWRKVFEEIVEEEKYHYLIVNKVREYLETIEK